MVQFDLKFGGFGGNGGTDGWLGNMDGPGWSEQLNKSKFNPYSLSRSLLFLVSNWVLFNGTKYWYRGLLRPTPGTKPLLLVGLFKGSKSSILDVESNRIRSLVSIGHSLGTDPNDELIKSSLMIKLDLTESSQD